MRLLFPLEILHAWGHAASLLAHLPRFYKTIFVCPKKFALIVKPRDILLSHVAIFKKQVPESLCVVEAGKGRVAETNRAAFTQQSLTSVVVKARMRLTRAFRRVPHPPPRPKWVTVNVPLLQSPVVLGNPGRAFANLHF